jgi:TolB-like protein/DNA-binding winged helix-turn-helix (wHTH) protein/Tfp pilus assembly protein PilF
MHSGELSKDGTRIRLPGQPFRILTLLLEQPGAVVRREDLKKHLWPTDTFVDFDHGLNKAMNQLRTLLNDSAEHPKFIATLPKLGYRFIAAVEVGGVATTFRAESEKVEIIEEVKVANLELGIEVDRSSPHGISRPPGPGTFLHLRPILRRALVPGLTLLVLSLMASGLAFYWLQRRPAPSAESIRLVILPFRDLSRESNTGNLADGLTYTFTNELGQIRSLEMISSRSVMHLKKQDKTTAEISRELKVDWLVDPAVQFAGEKVTVSLQLIEGKTDRVRWASPSYVRNLSEIANLQRDLAREIAYQLKAGLRPEEKGRLNKFKKVNAEAYKNYLSGRFHYNSDWGGGGSLKGIEYYQKAIDLDPTLAEAYAGIAEAYACMAHFGMPFLDAYQKAKSAGEKALALEESLPEAQASMASVKFALEWNWKEASELFAKAYNGNPNYTTLVVPYTMFLIAMGRFQEAVDTSLKGAQLEPYTVVFQINPGWCYLNARRFDEAAAYLENLLKMKSAVPNSEWNGAYWDLIGCYAGQGNYQKAYEIGKQIGAEKIWGVVWVLSKVGKKGEAEKILSDARRHPEKVDAPSQYAGDCAMMGRVEDALFWLEEGFQKRDPWMVYINIDVAYDSMRSDPRFKDLLRRMNFPN